MPGREFDNFLVIGKRYSIRSDGRSGGLLWQQVLEFCVDSVGHRLDATHLLYSGIDSRGFLNGHQINGIESLKQREAGVSSLGIGVQHRAKSFDRARRKGTGVVVRGLRHTLKGRYQRRFAVLLETPGNGADNPVLDLVIYVAQDRRIQSGISMV